MTAYKGRPEVTVIQHSERATNYLLVIIDAHPDELEGFSFGERHPYLVSILSPVQSCYPFYGEEQGFLSWGYVSEKLGLNETDAKIVTRLIGKEIGRPTTA